jgi:hypothetical protein
MGFRMTEVDLASPDCRLMVVDVMAPSSGPHFWPTFIGAGCAVLYLSHLVRCAALSLRARCTSLSMNPTHFPSSPPLELFASLPRIVTSPEPNI